MYIYIPICIAYIYIVIIFPANTPKYGLLFHSSFIGRAAPKHKGRISRFLANKCAIASRIDSFSDVPVPTFGEMLRQQVNIIFYFSNHFIF